MEMVKYWIFASAELMCSNRNFGSGAWYSAAPSLRAALNRSQLAAAFTAVGDKAKVTATISFRIIRIEIVPGITTTHVFS
jgi:hypothetical protein